MKTETDTTRIATAPKKIKKHMPVKKRLWSTPNEFLQDDERAIAACLAEHPSRRPYAREISAKLGVARSTRAHYHYLCETAIWVDGSTRFRVGTDSLMALVHDVICDNCHDRQPVDGSGLLPEGWLGIVSRSAASDLAPVWTVCS